MSDYAACVLNSVTGDVFLHVADNSVVNDKVS